MISPSSIFDCSAGGTVYTRANGVAGADGMVGAPYDALEQGVLRRRPDHLLLLQYETLTTDPARQCRDITFIGEPAFEHDFAHVDYDVTDFDERAGTPGLHTVGPKVKAEPRASLLPPDLFNRFVNDAFWRDPRMCRRSTNRLRLASSDGSGVTPRDYRIACGRIERHR